jgi:hypothetical protein
LQKREREREFEGGYVKKGGVHACHGGSNLEGRDNRTEYSGPSRTSVHHNNNNNISKNVSIIKREKTILVNNHWKKYHTIFFVL